MTIYTVHAPIDLEAGSIEAAERLILLKEGFCWPALIVPVLWLLVRRMWIVLAIFVAVLVGIASVRRMTGPVDMTLLYAVLVLFLGVMGNDLRRWTLARHGYRLIDVVEAGSRDDAEIRHLHGRPLSAGVEPVAVVAPSVPVFAASAGSGDIVGLFPTAGTSR